MKLQMVGTANRRILNIEPQNFEVSLSIKLATPSVSGGAKP
jgi:hypothetical protein